MEENNINLDNYQELNNKLSKDGKTSMYFANDIEVIGLIAAKDMAKDSSKIAIDTLKKKDSKLPWLLEIMKLLQKPLGKV